MSAGFKTLASNHADFLGTFVALCHYCNNVHVGTYSKGVQFHQQIIIMVLSFRSVRLPVSRLLSS